VLKIIEYAEKCIVRKHEEKRPFARPRHRWVNNIEMDLKEIGHGGLHWTHLLQNGNEFRGRGGFYEHGNKVLISI
jgi:hypothetical protein